MSAVHILLTPEPIVPRAMGKLLEAIDGHDHCCDPTILALRAAALVSTVRRWLVATKGHNVHSDLRLAAELSEYERRWSSSSVIAVNFARFQRDSRRLMQVIEQRLPPTPVRRSAWRRPSRGSPARPPLPLPARE